MQRATFNLYLVLLSFVICVTSSLSAQTFTLRVTDQSGNPLQGVKVFGNHGVNSSPIRATNSSGRWSVDLSSLTSSQPSLFLSGLSQGVLLEPSEINITPYLIQGGVFQVRAIPSSSPSTVIEWTMRDSGGNPLRDLALSIADPFIPACQLRLTDATGYVVAPARFRQSACSDSGPSNQAFYRIVPVSPNGLNCSFSSAGGTGHAICPQAEVVSGNTTAICPPITAPPSSGNVIYELEVMNSQNQGVPGIEFYGNESFETLSNRMSGGDGRYRFETRFVPGANAGTRFSIIPVSQDYIFVPNIIDTKRCSLIGGGVYRCRTTAIRSSAAQGALRVRVQQSGSNLQGVSFAKKALHGCESSGSMISDKNGMIVLPIIRQQSCNDSDSNSWNDFVSLLPNLLGKSFSHSSSTPFKVCPTQLVTDVTIQANDDNVQNRYFNVQAKVINPAGTPLADIHFFDGANQLGQTDALGNFLATVQQGSKLSLEAKATPYSFDPVKLELVDLSIDINSLTFTAVLPDTDDIGVTPPDNNFCPPSAEYIVSGIVRDLSGTPLVGASIFNNNSEEPVAFSDQSGRFAVQIAALTDAWITVESGSKLFSPAGFSFPNISCNQEIEFDESLVPEVTLIGQVTTSSGLPLVGAQLNLAIDGQHARSTLTNDSGLYTLSAPESSLYEITVLKNGYTFSPSNHSGTAESTRTDLDFSAKIINPPVQDTPVPPTSAPPTQTALPSVTAVHTATVRPTNPPNSQPPVATAVPTATITRSATAVHTATIRPTNPPVSQPTVATAVPTATFTSAATVTATKTAAPLPPGFATISPQPTSRPKLNPTPIPTSSATSTRAATNPPGNSLVPPTTTPGASPSNTRTPIPSASVTATRSPIPSLSPSNPPTSTATPVTPTLTPTQVPFAPPAAPSSAPSAPPTQAPPAQTQIPAPTIGQPTQPPGAAPTTAPNMPVPPPPAEPTPVVVVPPTPSATPTPILQIQMAFRDDRGRILTDAGWARLNPTNPVLVLPERYGTVQRIPITSPSMVINVAPGTYRVRIESNRLVVASIPRIFTFKIGVGAGEQRSGRATFAVRRRR